MTLLYIDIETIPDDKFKDDIVVSPPGNMSKPETIAEWENGLGKYTGVKNAAIDAEFRKLALNGTKGKIFCIAWAYDDGTVNNVSCYDQTEKDMLQQFLADVKIKIYSEQGRPESIKWIGHYISGFDLRFIWQRCVINNVKPVVSIPYDAKPWDSTRIFDTCTQWKGNSSSSGSLDDLCKAFGIEGKNDMDGSKVYDEYLAGNYKKIIDYCKDDVGKVRHLYKRMNFL